MPVKFTVFTYSKAQASRIYCYLDCNNMDICKAFGAVWYDRIFNNQQEMPTLILDLIDKIARTMKSLPEDRSFDRVWRAMHRSGKQTLHYDRATENH